MDIPARWTNGITLSVSVFIQGTDVHEFGNQWATEVDKNRCHCFIPVVVGSSNALQAAEMHNTSSQQGDRPKADFSGCRIDPSNDSMN
jgi:hypothetical protein